PPAQSALVLSASEFPLKPPRILHLSAPPSNRARIGKTLFTPERVFGTIILSGGDPYENQFRY
ncbi:MAG TPA: hypothetical protein VEZ72_18490, partial [Paenibacillus sp.]|nr:hypothetical protein [Paenibacillus sp.]